MTEDNDKTHWISHDNVCLLEENFFLQDSRVSVIYIPEAIKSEVRIPCPVDFSDFRPPGRIIVQS